ncbi:MAG: hypothetical protein ABL890_03330 [Candidatus Peribacteraceae bacterium]
MGRRQHHDSWNADALLDINGTALIDQFPQYRDDIQSFLATRPGQEEEAPRLSHTQVLEKIRADLAQATPQLPATVHQPLSEFGSHVGILLRNEGKRLAFGDLPMIEELTGVVVYRAGSGQIDMRRVNNGLSEIASMLPVRHRRDVRSHLELLLSHAKGEADENE